MKNPADSCRVFYSVPGKTKDEGYCTLQKLLANYDN